MNNLFTSKIQESPFLIMAHRGTWGGNIIENTRQAAELAVRSGADIVEIDICRSRDGEYYLYHDGNEATLLGVTRSFMEMTSQEINELIYNNSIGTPSGYHVEKLQDFLEWLPANYLINLDRSWPYWQESDFFELLRNSSKQDQLLLKSPVQADLLQYLPVDLLYMPIIYRKEELKLFDKYPHIQIAGLELIVKSAESELIEPSQIRQWQEKEWLLLANSESLGLGFNLFKHLDDDKALFDSYELTWGRMVELGINVIQTDWPYFLLEYRQQLQKEN